MNKTANKYSPEVRERAVRVVLSNDGQHKSRWSAIQSISAKIPSMSALGKLHRSGEGLDE